MRSKELGDRGLVTAFQCLTHDKLVPLFHKTRLIAEQNLTVMQIQVQLEQRPPY